MPPADRTALGAWRTVEPTTGAGWFSTLEVPWWIAGGWAVDLYCGIQSRAHADLDIGILRGDITTVVAALSSWEIFEAQDGKLTRLAVGEVPRSAVHSLWCRPAGTTCWAFELLLDESIADQWCYRREPSIRRRLSTVVRRNPAGIPYLAPEIQLLYKARGLRSQDQADFELIAPRLDARARAWLVDSLARTESGHPWSAALTVDVREARVGDREVIAGLLDDYLHELAHHREFAAIDSRRYPYLEVYFSEPGRYPLLIWHKGKVVGFAFIRDPVSTGLAWQLAEFYVTPDSRRTGIGRAAIAAIWRRFPGAWELQVQVRNTAACNFWTSCLEGLACETPTTREIEAGDGKRVQFNFHVSERI
jgi:predicted acetyltransferase